MDKALIRKRFSRATNTYRSQAVVQKHIAQQMTHFMKHHSFPHHAACVFEFGCGSGGFTANWTPLFMPQKLLLNDLCPEVSLLAQQAVQPGINTSFLEGDVEQIALPSELDAIVSCSAIQWLEHPEIFLNRCALALKPSGFLVFSTFGPQNVHEVRQLTGATLPYRSLQEWCRMLSSDFSILHQSEEIRTLSFDNPLQVLHHLKETGVTGIRKTQWTKTSLNKFTESYNQQFALDHKHVSLTYHPLYIVAQKK